MAAELELETVQSKKWWKVSDTGIFVPLDVVFAD